MTCQWDWPARRCRHGEDGGGVLAASFWVLWCESTCRWGFDDENNPVALRVTGLMGRCGHTKAAVGISLLVLAAVIQLSLRGDVENSPVALVFAPSTFR